MLPIREDAAGVTIQILVTPRASRDQVGPLVGDRLKVSVTAPPVEGEANAAVLALLARALGVAPSALAIMRGEGSRRKTVRVSGVARAAVEARL